MPPKSNCSITKCTTIQRARGLCRAHLIEWREVHIPFDPLNPPARTVERFWEKVDKSVYCWNWIGTRNIQGYGLFSFNCRMSVASRVAYEMKHGAIPDGLQVLHHCDNPSCVRAEHLFLGTQQENMADATRKGRAGAFAMSRRTHCPQGHPYSPENTYIYRTSRSCRECKRQHDRDRYWAAKQG